ncbi:MAG: hypothetical protein ACLQU3_14525 [Limisphaerales bacterium]
MKKCSTDSDLKREQEPDALAALLDKLDAIIHTVEKNLDSDDGRRWSPFTTESRKSRFEFSPNGDPISDDAYAEYAFATLCPIPVPLEGSHPVEAIYMEELDTRRITAAMRQAEYDLLLARTVFFHAHDLLFARSQAAHRLAAWARKWVTEAELLAEAIKACQRRFDTRVYPAFERLCRQRQQINALIVRLRKGLYSLQGHGWVSVLGRINVRVVVMQIDTYPTKLLCDGKLGPRVLYYGQLYNALSGLRAGWLGTISRKG